MTAMNPITFDNEQFERILTELKSGTPLDQACRIAHVGFDVFRRELESSSHLAEIIDDACATARSQRQQARTYDDPVDNIGRDEPPTPAYEDKPKRKSKPSKEEKPDIDWSAIFAQAEQLEPGPYGRFLWLNEQCAEMGMHSISPWWLRTTRAYYASGKRWLVVRCGRGGGKSTTLVRIASCESLFGDRFVPPGQVWPWIFVSVSTGDAGRRIPEAAAILGCLGVEYKLHRMTGRLAIDFRDHRGNDVQFLSLACNISSLSGPTSIGGTVDEEAKFFDKALNANPATEVLASMLQTFRGREDPRGVRCSSAWGTVGSHAQAVAAGDTSQNYVARIGDEFVDATIVGLAQVASYIEAQGNAHGAKKVRDYAATVTADSPNIPTWVANPTISAMACYQANETLAASEKGRASMVDLFLRENVSLPFDGGIGGGSFDPAYLQECNAKIRDGGTGSRVVHTFNGPRDNGKEMRLQSFPGLPSYDPRSTRFGCGGRQGSTF